MLTSALDHYRRQQRLQATAIAAARKARRDRRRLLEVVIAFQVLAARDALAGVDRMLDEQSIDAPPTATVSATSLAGTASDGRALATLFEQATTDYWFGLMVATQVKDAARGAAGLSVVTRPALTGYVRMLNPPSCSRCAILAGKFYRWNQGFDRHPGCDCIHIPRAESSPDLTTNPNTYFDSLDAAAQDRTFTKAGARAIRDGADIGQVVNVRRGMERAQVYGRDVLITREGITRLGRFGRSRGNFEKQRGRRYQASSHVRLMPESIYEHAESREDAVRLLRLHGYIT